MAIHYISSLDVDTIERGVKDSARCTGEIHAHLGLAWHILNISKYIRLSAFSHMEKCQLKIFQMGGIRRKRRTLRVGMIVADMWK